MIDGLYDGVNIICICGVLPTHTNYMWSQAFDLILIISVSTISMTNKTRQKKIKEQKEYDGCNIDFQDRINPSNDGRC